jgi:hypothetical protein
MPAFTESENYKLLACVAYLAGRHALPIGRPEPPINDARAVQKKKGPLKTLTDAILLNDMFASFLSTGESGCVIAVSTGFGLHGECHVVCAGNAGRKGVSRPKNELCTELERACTKFIAGSTNPPHPGDTSGVLVASLNICHIKVARRLKSISENINTVLDMGANSTTSPISKGMRSKFRSEVATLKGQLNRWAGLVEPHEKIKVATDYGRLLEVASELWDRIEKSGSIRFERCKNPVREFSNIAKGLSLLRRFVRGTTVVFDWPQGPPNSDGFTCQPANAETVQYQTLIEGLIKKSAPGPRNRKRRKKMRTKWKRAIQPTDRKLHCEIYLALHILFSSSNVGFPSFLVEKGKQVFAIGCSMPSCIACWDILLALSRQNSPYHPILMCRTSHSHGKCYTTWGLTPHINNLPPSLAQAVKGRKRTQMLKSLNCALKCSLLQFEQRLESAMHTQTSKVPLLGT